METTPQWFDILSWDSNFFGYPVARLKSVATPADLVAVHQELEKYRVRLVYWSVPPDDSAVQDRLAQLGAQLVDKKITFIKLLDHEPSQLSTSVAIRSYAAKTLSPELRALAIQAGLFSRFQVDPHIGYNKFVELYTLWLEKSVRRELAEDVLVARDTTKPEQPVTGVATVGHKGTIGDIGLVAVDEHYRGQGIASALMQAADKWFYDHYYRNIQVVTQGDNVAACGLYIKAGYHVGQIEWLYHYWL